MSEFCGKCDFADFLSSRDEDYIGKSKFYIYINGKDHRLDIHSRKDAIPYYPHLVSSAGSDIESCSVFLTSNSFIDREEREHLGWVLRDALKYFRKCKRNKIKFDEDEVLKKIVSWRQPNDNDHEIVHRVAEYGEKATIDGLHDSLHDYYRKKLYEEMVENGYDKNYAFRWCFGLERLFDLNNKKKTIDEFFTEKDD